MLKILIPLNSLLSFIWKTTHHNFCDLNSKIEENFNMCNFKILFLNAFFLRLCKLRFTLLLFIYFIILFYIIKLQITFPKVLRVEFISLNIIVYKVKYFSAMTSVKIFNNRYSVVNFHNHVFMLKKIKLLWSFLASIQVL